MISKFHFRSKPKISIPENHYWTIFYDIRVYKKRSFHIINLYDPISFKYTLKGIRLYSQMTTSFFSHTWKYYLSHTSKRHFSTNTSNASDRWFDRFPYRFHGMEHGTWIIGQWTQGGFRFCLVGRSRRFSLQSGKLLTAIFPKTERFPLPRTNRCSAYVGNSTFSDEHSSERVPISSSLTIHRSRRSLAMKFLKYLLCFKLDGVLRLL